MAIITVKDVDIVTKEGDCSRSVAFRSLFDEMVETNVSEREVRDLMNERLCSREEAVATLQVNTLSLRFLIKKNP